ncbi:efflux RND transporter periplasmic adaptor subunit [Marinimicrobium agarilyticum]|uniref:efflux RND transporter periplasmic adaptor subunit n=1 Tax=Marinimicrobium agarilyticum TaxID=306546 RepID=UPI000428FB46|nr:efflux RND transporter periplasmic adaptor subunit [Marinimicrobium agarilyticum]
MNRWIALIAFPLLVSACSEGEPSRADSADRPAPELDTYSVVPTTVAEETRLDGVLEAVHRSTVSSEVSARVMELPFDVDDYVEKGEVIVRFRDAEQQARMATAQATLQEARAQLTEARQAYERGRELFERELIARAELDRLTATFESAQARVSAAEAGVRAAQENLERTVVRAPYSGIVEERHIELGETAGAGQPLLTGLSLEHLRAVVEVPQSLVGPLREHGEARVILPDGTSLAATDVRISPAASEGSHTFRTRVTLPEGDHQVFPGTLVKVAFKRGEQKQLQVPASAVVQRSEVTGLYVVHPDHRIELRQVRAGELTPEGQRVILSGLDAGERVALDPIAAGIALKERQAQ